MEKVGIVTWHYIGNFGSALQAYALQTVIRDFGYEVKIIDYRKGAKCSFLKRCHRYLKSMLISQNRKNPLFKRKEKFFAFYRDLLNLSETYSSQEELEKKANNFDIYICGSDQIWSPNLLDPVYLLNFVADKKKISYAPSVVIDNFSKEDEQLFKKFIPTINFISVREEKGAQIVKKITGVNPHVVMDPTFLLQPDQWSVIEVDNEIAPPYILSYFLGNNPDHRKWVKYLQEKLGYKILSLPFNNIDKNFGEICDYDAGPREFIGLIKNASIVCTDSFHGVALSIIFKKNFYAFNRFDAHDPLCQNDRILNILEKLGLMDRLIHKIEEVNIDDPHINYQPVAPLMFEQRRKSIEFLKNALLFSSKKRIG